MRQKLWVEQTPKYIAYLPYGDLKNRYGEQPLQWLFENHQGNFTFVNLENVATEIHFKYKQDMEMFILMWGEFLMSKKDLNKAVRDGRP